MVSQYGGSSGVSFAADLLNAYNQRDYNLINTQMDPIMQLAGSMNPLVGQLQQRAELEQLRYNAAYGSSAFYPTAPTPGYTVSTTPYNYASPLLNAAGQIYPIPTQTKPSVLVAAPVVMTPVPVLSKPVVVAVPVAPKPVTTDPAAAAWFGPDSNADAPAPPKKKEGIGGALKRLFNKGQARAHEVHERNAERRAHHHEHNGDHKHSHQPGEGPPHGHGQCQKKC